MLGILSQACLKTLLLVFKAFVYTAEITQDFCCFPLQAVGCGVCQTCALNGGLKGKN